LGHCSDCKMKIVNLKKFVLIDIIVELGITPRVIEDNTLAGIGLGQDKVNNYFAEEIIY